MKEFYGHFAAAYGTFWLVLLAVALVTGSRINAGPLVIVGFPIVAVVYAGLKRAASGSGQESELGRLQRRVANLEREIDTLRR